MLQLSAQSSNCYQLAQQVPIITTTTLTRFIIKLNYAAIITTETIMVTTTTLTTTVTITTTTTYTTTITTTTTTTTTTDTTTTTAGQFLFICCSFSIIC